MSLPSRWLLGCFLWFAPVISTLANPILFTVTVTANSSAHGYVGGSTYTFTFQTGPDFPTLGTLGGSSFTLSYNSWYEDTTSHSQLFTSLAGTGLMGSFVRPTGTAGAPSSSIYNTNAGNFQLYVSNEDSGGTLGVTTPSGTPLRTVFVNFNNVNLTSPIFSGSYVDPADYWASHVGVYGANNTLALYNSSQVEIINFTPVSVQVAAVPEPAAVAAWLGVLAFAGVLARRRVRVTRA